MDYSLILERIVNEIQEDVNTAPERKEQVLTEIVQSYQIQTNYRNSSVSVDVYGEFYDKCVKLEHDRQGLDDYNIEGKRMVPLIPDDPSLKKLIAYGPISTGIIMGTIMGVAGKSVWEGIGMAVLQTIAC